MRKRIVGAVAAILWCSSANAATIVQTVTGSQVNPASLTLFDPLTGFDPLLGFPAGLSTLVSVQVEGTINASVGVLRTNTLDLSAATYSSSGSGSLELSPGTSFAPFSLSGTESYAAGSVGGAISLSGSLFTILTGPAVSQFRGGTSLVMPDAAFAPPVGGQLTRGGLFSYALTFTYTYDLPTPIPEPTTWAMMVLGFAGLGLIMRRRPAETGRVSC
jgi:hypothetical protein